MHYVFHTTDYLQFFCPCSPLTPQHPHSSGFLWHHLSVCDIAHPTAGLPAQGYLWHYHPPPIFMSAQVSSLPSTLLPRASISNISTPSSTYLFSTHFLLLWFFPITDDIHIHYDTALLLSSYDISTRGGTPLSSQYALTTRVLLGH